MHRIEAKYPRLERALVASTLQSRVRATVAACRQALSSTSLNHDDELNKAVCAIENHDLIPETVCARLLAKTEQFDGKYFDLADEGQEFIAEFQRARASAAV